MTKLTQLWERQPVGPWRGKVTINALTGHKLGRSTSIPYETLWQVVAEWDGPPPAWMPAPEGARVHAQDTVIVRSYTAALRAALETVEQLRAPAVPDLRVIAGAGSISAARAFL